MEYWVLADSTHPLILKVVSRPYVYQTVRIERPESAAAPAAIERALTDECRAELPGIYFAFASAALDPASNPALAQAAALLGRHADWSLVIEGHTDSIGDPARNRALSLRRAEAVREALVERHGIAAGRVEATGLGDTKPREPNGTLEGRARNRRVELVRRCAGANGNGEENR
jgi:outer membrane protein OmpA-like peptidoglycan-associated protein